MLAACSELRVFWVLGSQTGQMERGQGLGVDVTVRGAQFRCPDASHWLETSNSVFFAELEHWGLEVGRLEEEHEMARKSASKST